MQSSLCDWVQPGLSNLASLDRPITSTVASHVHFIVHNLILEHAYSRKRSSRFRYTQGSLRASSTTTRILEYTHCAFAIDLPTGFMTLLSSFLIALPMTLAIWGLSWSQVEFDDIGRAGTLKN
ncbi:hypothetical protein BDN70DRAFT_286362 [Pholiota conissans]|uniref:Uncharacterized protein n=1 Tax=Pholiota conissans TaxID=109636 RepID=A0A9P5YW31_9AGAR|nr:hypothetical protein BDN70DRAFT_286362 [Pholiota conissans]